MEARLLALRGIADALFPELQEEAESCRGTPLELYYATSGGSCTESLLKVLELMERRLPAGDRRQLHILLRMLTTRLGSLLVLGRSCLQSGIPAAFTSLPRERREAVLQQWAASPHATLRKAFKGLDGRSPLLEAIDCPATEPGRPPLPTPQASEAEAAVAAALVDLSSADGLPGSVAAAAAALSARGLMPLFPSASGLSASVTRQRPSLVVDCDVVVVGSGAGGGPAAAVLAQAGLRVVVLEKAGLVPAAAMTLQEGQTYDTMYENGAVLTTGDGGISVLAGSTLGGGTRINWCASFRTPAHVRREWAQALGLPDFEGPKYDAALDLVCERLSVHTGFKHSETCGTLREGLQRLGVHAGEVPRNCLRPDCAGSCHFGCSRGAKQDTVNTWLADSARQGCRIITGAWAETVITEKLRPAGAGGHQRRKRAVGVLALAGGEGSPLRLVLRAPIVISSCGSLHTPALLLRSGITCGGNVGRNLRLHPATCVLGCFPRGITAGGGGCAAADLEDGPGGSPLVAGRQSDGGAGGVDRQGQSRQLDMGVRGPIRPWEGTLMSIFSSHVGRWEEGGYGSLLFTPAAPPGLIASGMPWLSGRRYKEIVARYPDACVVLVLTRDQGSGRVVVDGQGKPCIHYTLADQDKESMMQGMQLGLRCLAAAGSDLLMTTAELPGNSFSPAARPKADAAAAAEAAPPPGTATQQVAEPPGLPADDPALLEYLQRVQAAGIPHLSMGLFSAHQLGTAALGADPASSVLDPAGECWEVAGLHCCDGSALPTSTGVNPMISIEATSLMLAQGIAERWAVGTADTRTRRPHVQLGNGAVAPSARL